MRTRTWTIGAIGVLFGALLLPVSLAAAQATPPGQWHPAGNLSAPRYGHQAAMLPDGRVLIVGGNNTSTGTASAELYDSRTGAWRVTGSMAAPRGQFTATLLLNGKVLVAGGGKPNNAGALATSELYDPATGTWSATGSMATPREAHTATLLPTGQVLVAGGSDHTCIAGCGPDHGVLAELYDPATGVWGPTGSMIFPRLNFATTLLPNGNVLAIGGGDFSCTPDSCGKGVWRTAELYNPATGTWSATASMSVGRAHETATLLRNGEVLVAGGGFNDNGGALASAELYDPATGNWRATGGMTARRVLHTATLLRNGLVLVAGGADDARVVQASAELYDPSTGIWSPTASMSTPRWSYSATLLRNGTVLVAGGSGGVGMGTAEIYSHSDDQGNHQGDDQQGDDHVDQQGGNE